MLDGLGVSNRVGPKCFGAAQVGHVEHALVRLDRRTGAHDFPHLGSHDGDQHGLDAVHALVEQRKVNAQPPPGLFVGVCPSVCLSPSVRVRVHNKCSIFWARFE